MASTPPLGESPDSELNIALSLLSEDSNSDLNHEASLPEPNGPKLTFDESADNVNANETEATDGTASQCHGFSSDIQSDDYDSDDSADYYLSESYFYSSNFYSPDYNPSYPSYPSSNSNTPSTSSVPPPLEIFSEFPPSLVKEFSHPHSDLHFSILFSEIDRLLTCHDGFDRTDPAYKFTLDSTRREALHTAESTLVTLGHVEARIEEITDAFQHSSNVPNATHAKAVAELGRWRGMVQHVIREIKRLRVHVAVQVPRSGKNKTKRGGEWTLGRVCRRLEMLERLAGLWKGLGRRVSEQAAGLERGRILYSYNDCVECGVALDPAKKGVVEHEWRGLVDEAVVTWKSMLLVNDSYCSGCAGLDRGMRRTRNRGWVVTGSGRDGVDTRVITNERGNTGGNNAL